MGQSDLVAVPYLLYDDAQAAVDWFVEATGAEVVQTQLDKHGTLFHAEVRLGPARIMLGDPGPDPAYGGPQPGGRTAAMVLVYVDEVDALFERMVAASATVLAAPADQAYGDRSFGITDPQGHCWYFHKRGASDA